MFSTAQISLLRLAAFSVIQLYRLVQQELSCRTDVARDALCFYTCRKSS